MWTLAQHHWVSDNLATIRELLGISIHKFCMDTEVKPNSLINWEKKKHTPNVASLRRIEAYLSPKIKHPDSSPEWGKWTLDEALESIKTLDQGKDSIHKVCESLGVSVQVFYNWTKMGQTPKLANLNQIEKYLKKRAAYTSFCATKTWTVEEIRWCLCNIRQVRKQHHITKSNMMECLGLSSYQYDKLEVKPDLLTVGQGHQLVALLNNFTVPHPKLIMPAGWDPTNIQDAVFMASPDTTTIVDFLKKE